MRLAFAVVFLLCLASSAHGAAPEPGSESAEAFVGHEDWVKGQHAPDGQYCCDLSDGRIADVRKRDGHWEVFYAKNTWRDGTDQWLVVPDKALLPQQSPIYFPIAWIMFGHVYCVALSGAS